MTISKNDNFLAKQLYESLPSNLDVITLRSKYDSIFQWISLFDLNIYHHKSFRSSNSPQTSIKVSLEIHLAQRQ